jgi:hypothetical protein
LGRITIVADSCTPDRSARAQGRLGNIPAHSMHEGGGAMQWQSSIELLMT